LAGIVHWNLNTFFPTLQLFFESGRSCTIEGGQLSGAFVGLDPKLRFRLTDLTHEEDGRLVRTTLPEKFVGMSPSTLIQEATVAYRTSVAVKTMSPKGMQPLPSVQTRATVVYEKHVVVGLRLSGMKHMGYVWCRASNSTSTSEESTWGDVRVAGLRDDIPTPFVGFPQKKTKPGGEALIVGKSSMIRGNNADQSRER
jgi:hypothetical protein